MSIDVDSELGKLFERQPAMEPEAIDWANAVMAAIAIEAGLQTAGRVPEKQPPVPSLHRETGTVATLAGATVEGAVTLEGIKAYLNGKDSAALPVGGEAGRILRELHAGITSDVLRLAGRRGDTALRTTAVREGVTTSIQGSSGKASMRSELVDSVKAQVEARVTFDELWALRQLVHANAAAETVRLLATAVVLGDVTLEKLGVALGADLVLVSMKTRKT